MRIVGWTLAALMVSGVLSASADSLVFGYDTAYTDTSLPSGTAPWISATFTSIDKNTVSLEVKSLSLSKDEFVSFWGFNVNPKLDPSTFNFKLVSSVNYSGDSSVTTSGQNSVTAGGSVQLDFDLSLGNNNFGVGSDVIFYITSSSSLSVSDFYVTNDGSKSGYYSVAHIQGLSDGKSAWVDPNATYDSGVPVTPVPEASTLTAIVFFGLAAGLGAFRGWSSQHAAKTSPRH